MIKKVKSFLITLFILITSNVYSQEFAFTIDSIYGLNPTLYNGQVNASNLGSQVIGNPFLYENFSNGTVTIQHKKYSNLNLNYDILNQELLLKYKNSYGAMQIITLSSAWIDQFSVLTDTFKYINFPLIGKEIYQEIGNDSIKVLFSWKKYLKLSTSDNQKYKFTKAERKMYLYKNGDIFKFKNNKSFISLFDNATQPFLKRYLKQNKINVKKSSNDFILDLLIYCNNLKN